MKLTNEQQEILDGKRGETYAKIMETLVRYGELFGAEEMAPVTGKYGHLVTSFGLQVIDPVYKLMDQLIEAGVVSKQKFTMDPRPLDKNVPSGPIKDLVFYKFMYSEQKRYEKQLDKLGLKSKDGFSCACYFDEQGNRPKKGDVLSWAESSAVVYANSVLGARCNRNSGIIELFGSILGCVPKFGLLTDEGRKATWRIEVKTKKLPPAQVLGSAIGMKVMEDVPYVYGLSDFLGKELTPSVCDYLKNFGAASASNGAVGLYHIDGLTPEAAELGDKLIAPDAKTYVIDDEEIQRVIDSYPIIWKNKDAKPKMCFIGCPHLSTNELKGWIHDIYEKTKENGRNTTTIPTVLTAAPGVLEAIKGSKEERMAEEIHLTLSYICPLMYCDNPLVHSVPIITNSNKLRTYTSCRFYRDEQILDMITGKGRI
ncbi:aconitase X [Butyrivibrio proteoclasticus]|uniref:aconitase X n=1 Tax=Butyrivibrio proteoclasticus TaxID=43305 RepID=UPI00047C448F|nr:aconitase X [Butyrivibrio proteoclasticus]